MSWLKNQILAGDKGVGDNVERLTKATGIKKIVEKISEFIEKDCGCRKRKKWLNKIFSYNNLSKENKKQLDQLIEEEKKDRSYLDI